MDTLEAYARQQRKWLRLTGLKAGDAGRLIVFNCDDEWCHWMGPPYYIPLGPVTIASYNDLGICLSYEKDGQVVGGDNGWFVPFYWLAKV